MLGFNRVTKLDCFRDKSWCIKLYNVGSFKL